MNKVIAWIKANPRVIKTGAKLLVGLGIIGAGTAALLTDFIFSF